MTSVILSNFIEEAMENLAISRPIFYSEADFQHALAWQIQKNHPNYSIRFEYKPPKISERIFVDLWITDDLGESYAIELKYKTRNLDAVVNDEMYNLLDHSAQDLGRYDFLKDVHRVENIVSKNPKVSGFAILLTNDSSYWKAPRDLDTVDADFRIHEGRLINGPLSWKSNASSGTTMGREKTLKISGNYQMNWQDYSQISSTSYGKFRFLRVKIDAKMLFPIYTEHPDLYNQVSKNMILVEEGKKYDI